MPISFCSYRCPWKKNPQAITANNVKVIILGFITTLIYVQRANGEFEDLTDAIREDVKDDL